MLVLGKPTCRHPAVDTGERRGPFSEVGKDSQVAVLSAEQRGARSTLLFSFADALSSKTSSSPHLIRVEAGTPGQPNGGLGGPRAGGGSQLVESGAGCCCLSRARMRAGTAAASGRRGASPSAFSSRSRTRMPHLLAPASEAAERSAERDEAQECLRCPGLCDSSILLSLWWNLLVLRHGS